MPVGQQLDAAAFMAANEAQAALTAPQLACAGTDIALNAFPVDPVPIARVVFRSIHTACPAAIAGPILRSPWRLPEQAYAFGPRPSPGCSIRMTRLSSRSC